MIRLVLLICILLCSNLLGYGQSVECGNIGFEEGSFRGWERYTGWPYDSIQHMKLDLHSGTEHVGLGTLGHTITNLADGYDPVIVEKIPVVAPGGGQHSVKIGTSTDGSVADQLRTTFLVNADTPLLLYRFAVILQNPGHKPYQQPAFSLRITTMKGDTIPCGYYEASATNQTAGFLHQGDQLIYRNWTTNVLDLRSFVGQKLILEITAHGCSEGGHFGYAYFDAQCLQATITPSSSCTDKGQIMSLSAPRGFDKYQWNTGDTTSTITIKPEIGKDYSVQVQSKSTLRPDCFVNLTLVHKISELTVPTSQQITLCYGESYSVGDSIYSRTGTYRTTIRRPPPLCDSIVVTHLSVIPAVGSSQSITLCSGSSLVIGDSVYNRAGTYQTRIQRAAPLCDSIVTTQLTFTQIDLGPLDDILIKQGDSVQLMAPTLLESAFTYSWSPPEGLSCTSCAKTWAKPSQTTLYKLKVSRPDLSCETSKTLLVEVIPCTLAFPTAFTPNGDGINDIFTVLNTPCADFFSQLSIYNRWGQVIFYQEADSKLNHLVGWDGTFHGKAVDVGVYTYQITFKSPSGKIMKRNGALTLLR